MPPPKKPASSAKGLTGKFTVVIGIKYHKGGKRLRAMERELTFQNGRLMKVGNLMPGFEIDVREFAD